MKIVHWVYCLAVCFIMVAPVLAQKGDKEPTLVVEVGYVPAGAKVSFSSDQGGEESGEKFGAGHGKNFGFDLRIRNLYLVYDGNFTSPRSASGFYGKRNTYSLPELENASFDHQTLLILTRFLKTHNLRARVGFGGTDIKLDRFFRFKSGIWDSTGLVGFENRTRRTESLIRAAVVAVDADWDITRRLTIGGELQWYFYGVEKETFSFEAIGAEFFNSETAPPPPMPHSGSETQNFEIGGRSGRVVGQVTYKIHEHLAMTFHYPLLNVETRLPWEATRTLSDGGPRFGLVFSF